MMLIFYFILFLNAPVWGIYLGYESEFYHVAYGHFWKFDDMFLTNETAPEAPPENKNARRNYIDWEHKFDEIFNDGYIIGTMEDMMKPFTKPIQGGVMKEFNTINRDVYNASRKWIFSSYSWRDPDDPYFYNKEYSKMKDVANLCLQILIHARYKIDRAMTQREPIRNDKRFQLGYLFNRLRRLITEMNKLSSIAHEQTYHWWFRKVTTLIRLYEAQVRFDQDVKDTILLIKEVYARPAPYDKYIVIHTTRTPRMNSTAPAQTMVPPG